MHLLRVALITNCIDLEPQPRPCIFTVDPELNMVCRDAVTVEVLGLHTERVAAAISTTLQLAAPTTTSAPTSFLFLRIGLYPDVLEELWAIKDEEGRGVRACMKEKFQAEVCQIPRLHETVRELQHVAFACREDIFFDALREFFDYICQANGESFPHMTEFKVEIFS